MKKAMNGAARFAGAVLLSMSLAFAAVPAMAQAQQELAPDHVAMARKYVDLTDKSGIYETALVGVGIETLRTLTAQNPELLKPADEVIVKVLGEYRLRKGDLFDQFARVYAQRFTLDELAQIVAFYETPVGIKLAKANADANADLQKVMQVFEDNLRTEFFAKVRAGLKEKGIEL